MFVFIASSLNCCVFMPGCILCSDMVALADATSGRDIMVIRVASHHMQAVVLAAPARLTTMHPLGGMARKRTALVPPSSSNPLATPCHTAEAAALAMLVSSSSSNSRHTVLHIRMQVEWTGGASKNLQIIIHSCCLVHTHLVFPPPPPTPLSSPLRSLKHYFNLFA